MSTDRQLLLNTFVAKDDPRTYLYKPFLVADYYCATNGHMIIFIDNDGSLPEIQSGKMSDNKKVLTLVAHCKLKPEYSIDIPDGTKPSQYEDCHKCNGTGMVECFACNHPEQCEYCDGAGKIEKFEPIIIDDIGVPFASHYLHTLKNIGAKLEAGNNDESSFIFRGEIRGIKYMGALNIMRMPKEKA